MAIERTDVAKEITGAKTMPEVPLTTFGLHTEPTSTSLDTKLAIFEQEFAFFQQTPTMMAATQKIEATTQRLSTSTAEYNQQLTQLETDIEAKRAARRIALAKRNSTVDFYQNNPTSKRVRIYNVLRSLFLDPIAEKVIPLQHSEKDYQETIKQIEATRTHIHQTAERKLEQTAALLQEKTTRSREAQELTENWVILERNRALMYALQNPSRADLIFRQFAVQNSQDQNSALKSLQAEYATLAGAPNTITRTAEPKSSQKVRAQISSTVVKNGDKPNGARTVSEEPAPKEEITQHYSAARIVPPRTINGPMRVLTMSDNELAEFLKEQAGDIARNDLALLDDLKLMINHLLKNPSNAPGIDKLNDYTISVEKKKLPAWHLIPSKMGSESTLKHKLSSNLRVVYAIYRNGTQRIVLIDGIYTHTKFAKLYGGHH